MPVTAMHACAGIVIRECRHYSKVTTFEVQVMHGAAMLGSTKFNR